MTEKGPIVIEIAHKAEKVSAVGESEMVIISDVNCDAICEAICKRLCYVMGDDSLMEPLLRHISGVGNVINISGELNVLKSLVEHVVVLVNERVYKCTGIHDFLKIVDPSVQVERRVARVASVEVEEAKTRWQVFQAGVSSAHAGVRARFSPDVFPKPAKGSSSSRFVSHEPEFKLADVALDDDDGKL
ncbi:hypothetical protein HOE67_02345 [Candidatus Peregrinibacteria bacterium]|jgi:hypothetical protein|nr:hypothetical protein [Candidatus Peregrinibacteria bacterium]MBT4055929.1 hypothetical protein [Candidatus Peregrinibacteria bacterium]